MAEILGWEGRTLPDAASRLAAQAASRKTVNRPKALAEGLEMRMPSG
jgi:hypothetical protein